MKKAIYLLTALLLLTTVNAEGNSTTTTQPGVTIDEHGCITSAGFVYCALREKCIRPWEEQCNDGRLVPLNGTNTTTTTIKTTTTTTLKPKPTTTTIIISTTTTTVGASPSSSTSSSETTLITPTTTTQPEPILISEPVNITNETVTTLQPPTTIVEPPTTTIEPPTTLPPETIPTTTLKPECGNLYQEVGEECDTTASACGAGDWNCVNCKCVPKATTTTTLQPKSELEKLSSVMPKSIPPEYIVGGVVLIIIAIAIVAWIFGKEDDKQPGK
jgi:hypothetical protein